MVAASIAVGPGHYRGRRSAAACAGVRRSSTISTARFRWAPRRRRRTVCSRARRAHLVADLVCLSPGGQSAVARARARGRRGLKLAVDELLRFSRFDDLTLTEMAFKEEPDDERPKPQAFVAATSLQARRRGGGCFARSPLAHDCRPRVRFRSAARKGSKQWPAK
jgi:hypothetical protein